MKGRWEDYKCPHCQATNRLAPDSITELYTESIVWCKSCHKPVELIATEGLDDTFNLIASGDNDLF